MQKEVSMKIGSIYDKETGRVLMSVVAPDEECVRLQITDEEKQGIYFDQEVNGREFYIVNGEVQARPKMGLFYSHEPDEHDTVRLDVNEMLRIDNIPVGTVVVHPQGETVVDDGFIEWSSVGLGSHSFRLEKFPYQEVNVYAIVGQL